MSTTVLHLHTQGFFPPTHQSIHTRANTKDEQQWWTPLGDLTRCGGKKKLLKGMEEKHKRVRKERTGVCPEGSH